MKKEEILRIIEEANIDKATKDLVITAINTAYDTGKTEGFREGVSVGTKTAQIANLLLGVR